jgi:CarboxypepD_reg-like domain
MRKQKPTNYFIICLFLLISQVIFAQSKIISGVITDKHSEEPVLFASITFKNTSIGTQTDSSGAFRISVTDWPSDTLEISCVGYQPFYHLIDKSKITVSISIALERGTFSENATLRVKVNKGLLVWKKIVQNKPKNDRFRFANFSYELYNKLELDLKNINFEKFGKFKPLRSISELINQNIDTAEGIHYLPSYLTETLSDYYFQKNPKKRREIIKAVNTNGIKNESIIKMLGGMDQGCRYTAYRQPAILSSCIYAPPQRRRNV